MNFAKGEIATGNLPEDMVPSLESSKATPNPSPEPTQVLANASRPRARAKKSTVIAEDSGMDVDESEQEGGTSSQKYREQSEGGMSGGSSIIADAKAEVGESGSKRELQESPSRLSVPAKRSRTSGKVVERSDVEGIDLGGVSFAEDSALPAGLIPKVVGMVGRFAIASRWFANV